MNHKETEKFIEYTLYSDKPDVEVLSEATKVMSRTSKAKQKRLSVALAMSSCATVVLTVLAILNRLAHYGGSDFFSTASGLSTEGVFFDDFSFIGRYGVLFILILMVLNSILVLLLLLRRKRKHKIK